MSIFIEANGTTLLSSFFESRYKIKDLDNYVDIYRKQINGRKLRLKSKRVIINLKKKKGIYRIVDIWLKQPK